MDPVVLTLESCFVELKDEIDYDELGRINHHVSVNNSSVYLDLVWQRGIAVTSLEVIVDCFTIDRDENALHLVIDKVDLSMVMVVIITSKIDEAGKIAGNIVDIVKLVNAENGKDCITLLKVDREVSGLEEDFILVLNL